MTRLLRKGGIEPGEGRVFGYGIAVLFLTGWAEVSVTNVSETLFLKRVGVELLPYVFLANSLLLVVSTYAVGRLAGRVDPLRLLTGTFVGLALALLPLWFLVLADARSAFALLVIAAKQMSSIAFLVFWVSFAGLLDGRQAKRLFAPMMAGETLGAVCGSFASGPIGHAAGVASLLPVTMAVLTLAAFVTWPLRRLAPARLDRAPMRRLPPRPPATPALASLWRESWLFRLMLASTLLCGVLGPMLYYQFSYVADLATQGSDAEHRLLDLYAQFRGWINVGVLGLQLGGTARIFRRIGVPRASVVSPLVYLLGFAGLSVQLSLRAGVAAVAGASLQDHAVYDPGQRMLFTLFRDRIRPAVTALLEGPVKRAGGVVGNVVIIGALAVGSPLAVGYTGLPIAALWLATAIVLWRVYPALLLDAASRRRAHADETLPLAELIDPGTLRVLRASLVDPDRERCRAACELLAEAHRERALGALAHAVHDAPAANRPLLIETLHRVLERDPQPPGMQPEAAEAVGAVLEAPGDLGDLERAMLVRAYGRLGGRAGSDSPVHAVLARLLDDPAPAVRLAAAAALGRAGAAPGARDLDADLTAAVASEDQAARSVAREELRAALLAADGDDPSRRDARLALLVSLLSAPADRAGAAGAIADLAAVHHTDVAAGGAPLLAYARDPDPRVRAAVWRFVGHAHLTEHVGLLVEHVAAQDEREATAARDALRALGPDAVDTVLQALHFAKRSTRDALVPVVHEMRVHAAAMRAIVDDELDAIRRTLIQLHALAPRVSDLVAERLRDRVAESVHTVLVVLALLLHDHRIARLCRLLERSRGGRERAVLLEALEALLPPAERARLMPLLDDRSGATLAGTAAEALRRRLPSFDEALAEILEEGDPLTRAFLVATLDDATLARHGLERPAPAERLAPATDLGDDGHGGTANVLNRVEIVLHLRSLELFARLTTSQLTDLAAVVREQTHPAGATIMREGEFEDCMYLIVAGRVRITRQGQLLTELGPRDFFGEMAVFDGEMRSATATAAMPLRLLRLERHDLFLVMDEQPAIAIAICQTLTRRVRDLNERLQGPKREA